MQLKYKIYKYFIPIVRVLGCIFFDKKYLSGRYFGDNLVGWSWVLRSILWQKIFGFNRQIPWPVSPFITIYSSKNIAFDVDDLHNFQTYGTYYQNFNGKIFLGKGTYIGPNVGIITQNHDVDNLENHIEPKDVEIGKNCWIGMNSVILPGVKLGDMTIVGAGSVVTKSFPEGYCVIGGNPARVIRLLENKNGGL